MDDHVLDQAESYHREALDASARREVDRHLATCRECRDAFDAIGLAVRELAVWSDSPAIEPALEKRLVNIRPRAARPWWSFAAAAALVAVLAGGTGYAAGRSARVGESATTASSDTSLRTFLLLLEEPTWPPPQALATARSGYADWATDLRARDRYVTAEKLTEEVGVRISVDGTAAPAIGTPPAQNLSGWFLLRARDYTEAVGLARRGPHLRYGSILVRQLE